VPELADQEHPWVGVTGWVQEGHDGGGTGVPHHLEGALAAIGETDSVEIEIEGATGVDTVGGEKGHAEM
jgi:hypothetical protein